MTKMSVYLAEDGIRLLVGDMKRRLRIRKGKYYQLPAGTLINNVITDEGEVRKVLAEISRDYSKYAGKVNLILASSKIITKERSRAAIPPMTEVQFCARRWNGR